MSVVSHGQIRVLHVDDEPDFTDLTKTCLQREDDRFTVETATSADQGLRIINDRPPDCIVSDYDMPGRDGIDFFETVHEAYPNLPFILFTGKGSESVASEAISAGVTDYLQKTSGTEQYELLCKRIENAVTKRRAQTNYEELFEKTPAGLTIHDPETGVIIDANQAFGDILGYEPSVLEGTHPGELSPEGSPFDRETANRLIQETIDTGQQQFEWQDQTKTGGVVRVEIITKRATIDGDQRVLAVAKEITDQKERERRLQDQRDRLAAVFDSVPHPIIEIELRNGEPIVQQANDAFEETFGYPRERVLGESLDEFIVPEEYRAEATDLNQPGKEQLTVEREVERVTAAGEPRIFFLSSSRVSQEDPSRWLAAYIDITEHRRREQELRREQQRFQTLFEQLTQPLIEVEYDALDPIVTAVNPAFEETFGYDASTIVGESLDAYIVPEDRQDEADDINQYVREGGRLVSREVTRQTADGLREFLLENAVHEAESGGFAIYTDITDRKRREEALDALHDVTREFMDAQDKQAVGDRAVETARTVLDQPVNGLWLSDSGNERLEPVAMTEYAGELLGEQPAYTEGESLSWQAFEDGELRVYDNVRTEPERFNADTPIQSEIIVPLGEHGVINIGATKPETFSEIDISLARILGKTVEAALERADREQRLRGQRAELQRQNERLDEFTSVVSHDLQSPLHLAATRVELAREENESAHLADAAGALERMETLITDLLTMAREGTPVQETETVTLTKVTTECWTVVETADATLRTEAEHRIRADPGQLKQLLENLVHNAIDHGRDDVTVTIGDLATGFYVADDGPGIPAEEREEVFEAGYSTTEEGTGFGLNIVREVVEAHGWEIHLTDSEAGGARFEITDVEIVE